MSDGMSKDKLIDAVFDELDSMSNEHLIKTLETHSQCDIAKLFYESMQDE